jgi:hypothetical protein
MFFRKKIVACVLIVMLVRCSVQSYKISSGMYDNAIDSNDDKVYRWGKDAIFFFFTPFCSILKMKINRQEKRTIR